MSRFFSKKQNDSDFFGGAFQETPPNVIHSLAGSKQGAAPVFPVQSYFAF
jgi:hypothetical protein